MPISTPSRWREYGLPVLLLAFSLVTTTAIGARFMQNFLDGLPPVARDSDLWPWPWLLAQPSRFLLGIPFSASLIAILLTHEFGHYFACRFHKIRCTLPWVLPAPTLSGTAGAVIQIRGRIPDSRSLIDVGAYGPIAGYIVSLGVLVLGFLLSHPAPPGFVDGQLISFGQPLTLDLLHGLLTRLNPNIPSFAQALPHPILIAGWIGLFITSLNLLPGGQLDGGHILYALSPAKHKLVSKILILALMLLGAFFGYEWIVLGLILFFLGRKHPVIYDPEGIGPTRVRFAVLALAIFILSFMPAPV